MYVGAAGAPDNLDYYKSARKRTSTEKALKKGIAGSTALSPSRVKSGIYPRKSQDWALSSYGLFFEHVWCPTESVSNGGGTDGGAGEYYAATEERNRPLTATVTMTETKNPSLPIIPEVKLVRMTSLTLNKLSRPKGSWTSPVGSGTGVGPANPISDPPRNISVGSGRVSRTRIPSLTVDPSYTVPVVDVPPSEEESEGAVAVTSADDAEKDRVQETDGGAAEDDGGEYYADDTEIEIETMTETVKGTETETEAVTETVTETEVAIASVSSESTVTAVGVVMTAGVCDAEAVDIETVIEEAESALTATVDGHDDVVEEDVDIKSPNTVIEKDDYDNDFEDEVNEFEETEVEVEIEEWPERERLGEPEGETEAETEIEVEREIGGDMEGEVEAEGGHEMEKSVQTVSVTGETMTEDTSSFRTLTEKQCSDTDSYSYTCADSDTDSTSNQTGPSKDLTEGRDGSVNDVTIPYSADNQAVEEHLKSSVCKTADSNPNPCVVVEDLFQSSFADGAVEVEVDIALSNPSLAA
jgi:hypothetical protein